jgi:hypothetical protein
LANVSGAPYGTKRTLLPFMRLFSGPDTAFAFTTPTPPATFNTSRPAFNGTTYIINSVSDLNAAIAGLAAGTIVGGDIIAINPGLNLDGNFVFPARPGWAGPSDIVEIRTNVSTLALDIMCPQGMRMTPAKSATLNFATLRASFANGCIVTAYGASGYRFTALNVTMAPSLIATSTTSVGSGSLIRFGDTSLSLDAQACYDLVLDRCWVYGPSTVACRRGVMMCGPRQALVDSYLGPFYDLGTDSQAFGITGYKGPYMIINCHCEGWSEGFVTGGGNSNIDAANINGVISDVTIRRSFFTRDAGAKTVWGSMLKNGGEFKTGRRMLVEYCIFEHTGPGAQVGLLFSLKSTEQYGGSGPHRTLEGTSDVEFRFNWLRDGARGFGVAADPDSYLGWQAIPVNKIYVHDNLISGINRHPDWLGNGPAPGGHGLVLLGSLSDVTFDHNTWVDVDSSTQAFADLDADLPSMGTVALRSNIVHKGFYGFKAGGFAAGNPSIDLSWNLQDWQKNILIGTATSPDYPRDGVDTISLTAESDVGYTDFASLNVLLTPGSPGKAAGHDGADIGIANVPAFFAGVWHVDTGSYGQPLGAFYLYGRQRANVS